VLGDGASFLRRAAREEAEDSQGQRRSHLLIVIDPRNRAEPRVPDIVSGKNLDSVWTKSRAPGR
jgi:hypothetical protein